MNLTVAFGPHSGLLDPANAMLPDPSRTLSSAGADRKPLCRTGLVDRWDVQSGKLAVGDDVDCDRRHAAVARGTTAWSLSVAGSLVRP